MRSRSIMPLLVVAAAASLLAWLGPLTRAVEALLVLQDISSGFGPSVLKRFTPDPVRKNMVYPDRKRSGSGDLYLPGGSGAKAGLLMIPGVAEEGKDDIRLVSFATSLARAGFQVLVPDMEPVKRLQVGSADVQQVIAAFKALDGMLGAHAGTERGLMAFSYGVGPAVLSAMAPEMRNDVDFIVGVGGYYDLGQVLTFITTGYFAEKGKWRHIPPNEYGKWLFVLSNLHRLTNPRDRQLLGLIAGRKVADVSADVNDLTPLLGPEGKRIMALLSNSDPSKVPLLLSELPHAILAELEALDLANKDMSLLRARVLLLHGLDDDIIPYTQSILLAASLPPQQVEIFLTHGLAHVDVEVSFAEGFRLWRAVVALLRERDAR